MTIGVSEYLACVRRHAFLQRAVAVMGVLLLLAGHNAVLNAQACDSAMPGSLAASWTPDGSRLLYSSNRDGNWELYVVDRNGRDARRIRSLPGSDDYFPYASPDGRWITFMAIDTAGTWSAVGIVGMDGTSLRWFTQPGTGYSGDPYWSPDGRYLVYHSRDAGNDDIYVQAVDDANGDKRRRLTKHPANDNNPIWSPDGRRILFVSDRGDTSDIYVMNADGSGLRNLTSDPLFNYFPFWSPDGRRVLFSARTERGVSAGMEIWDVDATGRDRRQLTSNETYDSAPHWSPDGRSVAFASCRSGSYELYVMDADGQNVRRVTHTRWSERQ